MWVCTPLFVAQCDILRRWNDKPARKTPNMTHNVGYQHKI